MNFGRALYVDDDFGKPASPDLVFIAASVILGLVAAAGLWLADSQQRRTWHSPAYPPPTPFRSDG
jgi:hypothetical protein